MQTCKGRSISYGMTSGGIMVQVHHQKPPDDEWDRMVEAIRHESDKLAGILIVAPGCDGPSPVQRKKIAAVATTYPASFRGVVMFSNSILARGALTAINWLIPGGLDSKAYALSDLERGMDSLRIDEAQKAEVHQLLAILLPEKRMAL